MKLCSNNKKLKTSKENIFNILNFTFDILQINKLSNIFFKKEKEKKMEENEEFYGRDWKNFCNKRILQKFPNLERKISSSISNYSKVWSMHIKTIRKEEKNKTYFQNPFEGDDTIENNFLKNYFPNIFITTYYNILRK